MRLIEDVVAVALLILLPDNVLEWFGIYKSFETIMRRRTSPAQMASAKERINDGFKNALY